MMSHKEYKTASALRTALETRLQSTARNLGTDIQRLRRQVAFDRFLERLFAANTQHGHPWILKGGYAMELRIRLARTTKDIDLSIPANVVGQLSGEAGNWMLTLLQDAASFPISDGFTFLIGEARLDLGAAPEGGSRFPVHATMAGRTFARFNVDVGMGDELIEPAEVIQGEGWFDFAGLPRPEFRMISREQQYAEKIHAYTLPRMGTENSRVKDLIDLILLQQMPLNPDRVAECIRKTFARRGTHPSPPSLEEPPSAWETRFKALALECGLHVDMKQAFESVAAYYDDLDL